MRKILILAIAIFLFANLSYAENIQVGSFNIQYLGDGISDKKPRDNFDIRKLGQIIDLLDIDLLAVVEVENSDALQRLAAKMPKDDQGNAMYDFRIGESGGTQKIGIIFRKDRISFTQEPRELDELQEDWTPTKKLFPRLPLYAYVKAGDFDFHFVVLHLKAMFDQDSINRRKRELEKLRIWIEDKLASDKDVIIIGDLNDKLGSAPFAELNLNNKFYFCTSELSESAYTYIGKKSVIDHIIVTRMIGGSKVEYVEHSIIIFPSDILLKHLYGKISTLEKRLSDHRLIFATFKTD